MTQKRAGGARLPEGNVRQQDGPVTGPEENLDLTPAVIPPASDGRVGRHKWGAMRLSPEASMRMGGRAEWELGGLMGKGGDGVRRC